MWSSGGHSGSPKSREFMLKKLALKNEANTKIVPKFKFYVYVNV